MHFLPQRNRLERSSPTSGRNHPGLSLAAGHAKTKCEACHDEGNVAAPSVGSECVACHAQVHQAKFGDRCETCHASIRWMGLPKKDRAARASEDGVSPGGFAQECRVQALPFAQAAAATAISGACSFRTARTATVMSIGAA